MRISLPPRLDSFPVAFGDDQEIFPDHGLTVEPVAFSGLSERNTSLLTGRIDGVLSDISSLIQLLEQDAPLRITSTAFEAPDGRRRYALIAQPWAGASNLDELLGLLGDSREDSIGVNRRTDFEFETDRLLEQKGRTVQPSTFYADFADVLQLATLIASGSWLAGVLPEPIGGYLEYITEANNQRVQTISEFEGQTLMPSVLVFQKELVENNPGLIETFYAGYNATVAELNSQDRDEVVEIALDAALRFFFPGFKREELPAGAEEFLAQYVIPAFPEPRALRSEEYEQVAEWAAQRGYLEELVPFELAVTDRFASVLDGPS